MDDPAAFVMWYKKVKYTKSIYRFPNLISQF